MPATSSWSKISCLAGQLQLKSTLAGGQSFRWKAHPVATAGDETEWLGVFANCVWLLKQTDSHLMYKVLGELPYPETSVELPNPCGDEPQAKKLKTPADCNATAIVRMKVAQPKESSRRKSDKGALYESKYYDSILRAYFRLDVDLDDHYKTWSQSCSHFNSSAGQMYAVRMLDQDPVENLFSFICSQNNHITRISAMVEKLCKAYGRQICEFNGVAYHAFPDIAALSGGQVDGELRNAGFGYRAKFIQKSASEIEAKGGVAWFQMLKQLDYKDAHAELMKLTGIGPKVADCICLMSLSHLQAIPVDTHVFQIAVKHYAPHLAKMKSVTPKVYSEIGDKFREIYGPLAGWAQTVLFCADLRQFKELNKPGERTSSGKSQKKNRSK